MTEPLPLSAEQAQRVEAFRAAVDASAEDKLKQIYEAARDTSPAWLAKGLRGDAQQAKPFHIEGADGGGNEWAVQPGGGAEATEETSTGNQEFIANSNGTPVVAKFDARILSPYTG